MAAPMDWRGSLQKPSWFMKKKDAAYKLYVGKGLTTCACPVTHIIKLQNRTVNTMFSSNIHAALYWSTVIDNYSSVSTKD